MQAKNAGSYCRLDGSNSMSLALRKIRKKILPDRDGVSHKINIIIRPPPQPWPEQKIRTTGLLR